MNSDVTAPLIPEGHETSRNGRRPSAAPRKKGSAAGPVAAVALLGVLLAAGILPRMRRAGALTNDAKEAAGPPVVSVLTPIHAQDDQDLVLPGNMEAIEQTAINARTAGYMKVHYVDLGAHVKKGQLLAEIESPEVDQQLAQARADAVKAEAAVAEARASVGTQRAAVEQARADAAKYEAAVAQAQADAAKTRASVQSAQAETQRANAGVTAQNAEVTRMGAGVGQAKAALARAQATLIQTREALSEKKANLTKAISDQNIAKTTWERWAKLVDQGAVSGQEADEKKATYDARAADVEAAKASVSSAQANVEAAQAAVEASKSDVAAAEASVNTSQANVQAAQAGVGSNQANVQAAQEAVRSSDASVQAARSAWKSALANVRAAQQKVDAAQSDVSSAQAALKSAQANVQRYVIMQSFEKIYAPFDGVIVSRSVDNGALVNAGTTPPATEGLPGSTKGGMFMIARSDQLRIRVYVPQTFINRIHNGQKAIVTVKEFPHREFEGKVMLVAGALDPNSRTEVVGILLQNQDHLLTAGMYGEVRIAPEGVERSIHVPSSTLLIGTEGTRVATVTKAGTVHFVDVQLGDDLGTEVEIRGGLQGNEQLIDTPGDDLSEGTKVKAVPAPPKAKEGEGGGGAKGSGGEKGPGGHHHSGPGGAPAAAGPAGGKPERAGGAGGPAKPEATAGERSTH